MPKSHQQVLKFETYFTIRMRFPKLKCDRVTCENRAPVRTGARFWKKRRFRQIHKRGLIDTVSQAKNCARIDQNIIKHRNTNYTNIGLKNIIFWYQKTSQNQSKTYQNSKPKRSQHAPWILISIFDAFRPKKGRAGGAGRAGRAERGQEGEVGGMRLGPGGGI